MKRTKIFFVLALSLIFSVGIIHAEVTIYPDPSGIQSSTEYKVEIIQNGVTYIPFTHMMFSQFHTNLSKTNSWVSFAFTSPVTVRVTRLNEPITFCQVLPRHKEITVRQTGKNVIEFDVNNPSKLSVEFEKGIKITHPLLIFADAPETNIPDRNDPNVIWFEPGIHQIGENFRVHSNQTIYIAGGAFVKGKIIGDNIQNVKILGRGILSCEDYSDLAGTHTIQLTDADNVIVDGITIIYSAHFNLVLKGSNHIVRNVKLMSWWFSSDGIDTGDNGLIEDCFLKVNDDALKLYYPNTIARHNVIWQLDNGAPFQLGWSTSSGKGSSNYYIYDCDVIRVEHLWDNPNEADFAAILGGKGGRSHYLFENIRIDNANWRPFHLITQPNRWAGWGETGYLRDIVFRNVEIYQPQRMPSLIRGYNDKHMVSDILFENLKINGKLIHSAEEGNFIIYKPTTKNIVFRVTEDSEKSEK